jgi:hypothetical protein
MAKVGKVTSSTKVTFGKKGVGKAKKRKSPKDKPTKPYRGQGK